MVQPMAHICVLSIMEWTILQTHIKLAYPHLTEGSNHMSTWDATTNTTIKYSTCCVHHLIIAWTNNNFSLLFSNPTKPEFSVLLIQYSALRGLPTSVINHISFCTINSSVLAFSSTIPVKWYFQYYKEIQLEVHTFQVC